MLHHRGFARILSAGIQTIAVQVLGMMFFYILSSGLDKATFGNISWANAVAVMIAGALGFGIEQVAVRKIAANDTEAGPVTSAFLGHTAVASLLALAALGIIYFLPGIHASTILLLGGFLIVQSLGMLVVPFKSLMNARSRYLPYALIALTVNLLKIAGLVLAMRRPPFHTGRVVVILAAGSAVELLLTFLYMRLRERFRFCWSWRQYKLLRKEALPQYISVLFDISLARTDWILLGILGTATATADYSFAYRAFELARMPILIIGILVMPKLARRLEGGKVSGEGIADGIRTFYKTELLCAVIIAIILAIVWMPLAGTLSHGKYGASNEHMVWVLAACVPIHFAINFLWMLTFAARRYKSAARITVITALVNIGLNMVFIPLWGGLGAAFAFLIASVLQVVLYWRQVSKSVVQLSCRPPVLYVLTGAALVAGYFWLRPGWLAGLCITLPLFLFLTILLRQWSVADLSRVLRFSKR